MTYEKAIKTVRKYVTDMLNTKEPLNPYTDNHFLAEVVAEVIAILEFEKLYDPPVIKREGKTLLSQFENYFNSELSLHDTYKKLQESADFYRNMAIMLCIHNGREWTNYRNQKGTEYYKIQRKLYLFRKRLGIR